MLFHPGSGGVADLCPPQRQGHLTQTSVCKGTPTSAPGSMAPLLGKEGYSWLWGCPCLSCRSLWSWGRGQGPEWGLAPALCCPRPGERWLGRPRLNLLGERQCPPHPIPSGASAGSPSPNDPATGLSSCSCALAQSCPTLATPGTVPRQAPLSKNSPAKNTGVGCHGLLQGIFPTQGSNPGLPRCRQILYHLSHQGSTGLRIPTDCINAY